MALTRQCVVPFTNSAHEALRDNYGTVVGGGGGLGVDGAGVLLLYFEVVRGRSILFHVAASRLEVVRGRAHGCGAGRRDNGGLKIPVCMDIHPN